MHDSLFTRVAAAILGTVVAGSTIACGDALGPGSVAGTYALRQVQDDALPAVLFSTDFMRVRVLADTLRLGADHTGTQISVWEIEPLQPDLEFDNPTRLTTQLRFTLHAQRIEASIVCPPYALCPRPPQWVARLLADGLRVESAAGQRVPLLYARLSADE